MSAINRRSWNFPRSTPIRVYLSLRFEISLFLQKGLHLGYQAHRKHLFWKSLTLLEFQETLDFLMMTMNFFKLGSLTCSHAFGLNWIRISGQSMGFWANSHVLGIDVFPVHHVSITLLWKNLSLFVAGISERTNCVETSKRLLNITPEQAIAKNCERVLVIFHQE